MAAINSFTWTEGTSNTYDTHTGTGTGTTGGDDKLNREEFIAIMRAKNPGVSEALLNAVFDSIAGSDSLIDQTEHGNLDDVLKGVNMFLGDPNVTVADFIKQAGTRVGLIDSQMNSILNALTSSDLASTMKATTQIQQLSTILSQVLKLVASYQEVQNKAVDMRS